MSWLIPLLAALKEWLPIIMTILGGIPDLLKIIAMLLNNHKAVKKAIPDQEPSLINMVQHSANKSLLKEKEILPGPLIPDPELEKVIQANTLPLPDELLPKPGAQKHVSLIDGTVSYQ